VEELTIKIEPVPKARARVVNGHAFTPERTRVYEQAVAIAWRAKHKTLHQGRLKVSLTFAMKIPKSMKKDDVLKAVNGEIVPLKRPDIDNLIKAVLDALNGVAWVDDKQITKICAEKIYGIEPYVHIEIEGC